MAFKKVELKFHDHTLIIDECGNIYVKEISEKIPVLAVDMYYCTDEGRNDTFSIERNDKPAILLYGLDHEEPIVVVRYGKDGTATIEQPKE